MNCPLVNLTIQATPGTSPRIVGTNQQHPAEGNGLFFPRRSLGGSTWPDELPNHWRSENVGRDMANNTSRRTEDAKSLR